MAATKGQTLELAVLGLLHESPLHGYELRKRVNLLFGWSRLLSYGSLYPALKRMLRNNWIDEVTNTSISRRQRIVYQITPAGIEHFTQEVIHIPVQPFDNSPVGGGVFTRVGGMILFQTAKEFVLNTVGYIENLHNQSILVLVKRIEKEFFSFGEIVVGLFDKVILIDHPLVQGPRILGQSEC